MSFDATRWAWTVKGLSSTQILVLLAVCDMVSIGQHTCWPSQKYLAAKTSLSDRAVRAALKELELRKLIERKSRSKTSLARTSDLITVMVHPDFSKNRKPKTSKTDHCSNDAGFERAILVEIDSGSPRKDIPPGPGTTFQESNKEEAVSLNQLIHWDNDFIGEEMPEPGKPEIDVHNRAFDLFNRVRPHVEGIVDAASPGIKNTALLKHWVSQFETDLVAKRIIAVVNRRRRRESEPDPIQSWKFFSAEIERLATQPDGE